MLVMGADTAAGLGEWHRPERIVGLAEIVVARRPGTDLSAVEAVLGGLGVERQLRELEMSPIDVSSTQVRTRVRAGESIGHLVSDGVAKLIAVEGLYR